MKTKVIQTFRPYDVPEWLKLCLKSVESWAKYYGYDYEFKADEFFDLKPTWCTATDKWVISDICRLIWLKQETRNYDRVIWADADFLIFNKDIVCLDNKTHGFSFEIVGNVASLNNAFMYFNRGDYILDLYYENSKQVILAGNDITRTAIGPELLRHINNTTPLNIIKYLGLLYYPITAQLVQGKGKTLDKYITSLPEPVGGANMCNFMQELAPHSNDRLFVNSDLFDCVKHLISTEGSRLNKRWEK